MNISHDREESSGIAGNAEYTHKKDLRCIPFLAEALGLLSELPKGSCHPEGDGCE